MDRKKIIISIIIVCLLGVGVYVWRFSSDNGEKDIITKEESKKKQDYYQYKDLVRLETPLPKDKISSPLVIKGEARGMWYFEADFPVVLVNWDGLIIAEGIAQAQSDWMTEEYVPFETTLEFEADTSVSDLGSLILLKDNPSGLPAHDDALEIVVYFE